VDEIRRTNLFYQALDQYNKSKKASATLKITNNEIPLTSELISSHFETINNLSTRLTNTQNDADLFFQRAIEFSLVQDYKSALDDLNKAIELQPSFMLAYFYRANTRYKLLEYLKNNSEHQEPILSKNIPTSVSRISMDNEIIIHDYDKTIELAPDFSFAYFNKANVNCSVKNFSEAIKNYSKAIEIDSDFAEAYFNRGLTYLFTGEDSKGLNDLSKAGELGIYKSYNLIQRFKK
jgi:tetratricopeptide (TPR) repeat protein